MLSASKPKPRSRSGWSLGPVKGNWVGASLADETAGARAGLSAGAGAA